LKTSKPTVTIVAPSSPVPPESFGFESSWSRENR